MNSKSLPPMAKRAIIILTFPWFVPILIAVSYGRELCPETIPIWLENIVTFFCPEPILSLLYAGAWIVIAIGIKVWQTSRKRVDAKAQ